MTNAQKVIVTCPSCKQHNSAFTHLLEKTNCGKCRQTLSPNSQPNIPLTEIIEQIQQLKLSEFQKSWLCSRLKMSEMLPQYGGWFSFNIHSCTSEIGALLDRGLLQHRKYGNDTQVRVSYEAVGKSFARCQKQKEQAETQEQNQQAEAKDDANSSTGVVYLIKAGPHHKIGKTINIDVRFARLKIQLPYKPELVHSIKTNNIHKLEKHWHKRFASQRANGEWFELSDADVAEFVGMKQVKFDG